MTMQSPPPLTPAEERLVAQLKEAGAAETAVRFSKAGLPTRRVEAYHYTDLKALLKEVPPLASDAGDGEARVTIEGAHRLVLANGAPPAAGALPAGVSLSKSADAAITGRDDVLVRLNAGLARETLVIGIEGAVAPVLHLDRRVSGGAAHAAGAVRIEIAAGASVTIVETVSGSEAPHLVNMASALALGKGASVTHILVDLSAAQATHFASLDARLGASARLKSLVVHAGARLARTRVFADFSGEGAHADFLGLNLVAEGQHADITLEIVHAVPNTTSTETYKQIGRGRARAVFQGKIVVARDAQKTDAQMMTQGLMLSEEVEILAKPELEIFADDVVCAHGATCGDLDEDWLFYLMSRGIPRPEAQTMLVRAFLEEVVEAVEDEAVAGFLSSVAEEWLARGAR